jgi:hypothetical protein
MTIGVEACRKSAHLQENLPVRPDVLYRGRKMTAAGVGESSPLKE